MRLDVLDIMQIRDRLLLIFHILSLAPVLRLIEDTKAHAGIGPSLHFLRHGQIARGKVTEAVTIPINNTTACGLFSSADSMRSG